MYPDESFLIRFGGAFGTEGETWSCGIRAVDNAFTSDLTQLLPDVGDAIARWVQRSDSRVHGHARFDFVTITTINSQGKQVEDQTPRREFDPAIRSGTSQGPFQIAYALTFRTAKSRGRAARGRIYVPTTASVQEEGHLDQAVAVGIANSGATLLRDLTGTLAGLAPAVVSGVDGTFNLITRVECGDVLDTQRRRRRSLEERYVGVDL